MHTELQAALERLGVNKPRGCSFGGGHGAPLEVRTPIDGSLLASFAAAGPADVAAAVDRASGAFRGWRSVPAPRRGELVRLIGEELRRAKPDLAALITWEAGKIGSEAAGEVQEMIDICDFAVGLSRQLYGLTIQSERPSHHMSERWRPLGPVGIITAFNFPVAVWAWNAMIALVCGDALAWKPSEKTPLCGLACQALFERAAARFGGAPEGLSNVVIGGADIGQALAASRGLPLVSATGSVSMGRAVGQAVAARLGRSLLELGGNNGSIVAPSADLDLALRGIVFGAAGTCGQRCTTLRRLIVHESIAEDVLARLLKAYASLPIGDPHDQRTLVGPLIDHAAGEKMMAALDAARAQGGSVHGGGYQREGVPEGGCYVQPAVVEIGPAAEILQQETFAPILYLLRYRTLDEAIAIHNNVPQGLASSIFTNDLREAEMFCSATGSDCGIVNVNMGPSGAEIGGAFGGEKETGGGRESGSDAWKAYMSRATVTVNYSRDLPLAQGVEFG
jgi:aldehyde dehydrogenase (NAD+)